MNEPTLEIITAELEAELTGRKFGKIFLLSRFRLAIDFRLSESRFLFVSVEPTAPRIYLIKRRLRDLAEPSLNPGPFISFLRARLTNAVLLSVAKYSDDRILRFSFAARNDVGQAETYFFIVQMTGRSANLFLLDDRDFVLDSLRQTSGPGQEIAGTYSPPAKDLRPIRSDDAPVFPKGDFASLSEALDNHYTRKEIRQRFQNKVSSARQLLNRKIAKRKRLVKNLKRDSAGHGQAESWKRLGDLLLANLATAERSGNVVRVIDYYDEATPSVEIEIKETDSISGAAEKFFKKYAKARNARTEIAKRLRVAESELSELAIQEGRLNLAIEQNDEDALSEFIAKKPSRAAAGSKDRSKVKLSGARKFRSSDGFEILVGRRAKDNDHLTFRIAKSLDLWLHAADYPGSHVIVRNPDRQEIPSSTMIEAAQLAAFYSNAKSQPKAAVHYTQKKFVNKPKGTASGLVSLSSFKTILVEPQVSDAVESLS